MADEAMPLCASKKTEGRFMVYSSWFKVILFRFVVIVVTFVGRNLFTHSVL